MKTLKSLFMLCAGLSFCACSSDNEPQLPEGNGAVTVKLVNPLTRTEALPSTEDVVDGNTVAVTGTITVKLYENNNSETPTQTATINANSGEHTFWGVTNPTLVTASINGGIDPTSDEWDNAGIENYQTATAATVAAFGKVGTDGIRLTQKTQDHTDNQVTKKYQMYEASITMSVPFARIEFEVKRDANVSGYSSMNVGGVYLDQLLATGGATEATDYKHPNDVNIAANPEQNIEAFTTTATGINAVLFDTPTSTLNFTAANAVAPGDSKVYAYNIFPGSVMPKIKVWFKDVKKGSENVLPYQYAVVASYGGLTQFEEGKIYKITAASLTDNNIKSQESGVDADYAIEVTVEEASWTIVEATAEWM